MGYMITWVTLVLGEMDVAWVNPYRSDQGTSSAPGLICTPLSVAVTQFWGGGWVGDTRSATYPVDDFHQARIT